MAGEVPLDLVVSARTSIATDIIALDLIAADGCRLPPHEPGAHIDVVIDGIGRRSYSLYDWPGDGRSYRIAVLNVADGRGGSMAVHRDWSVGQTIKAYGPRNLFPLQPDGHSLLFAGGIGITPLLAMARKLLSDGRPFTLHYCARSIDRLAFAVEIQDAPLGEHVRLYFDDGPPDQRLDLDDIFRNALPNTHIYTCGPLGFIRAVEESAILQAIRAEYLHHELFSTDAVIGRNAPFDVIVASSGARVTVSENETIVEALKRVGIDVPVSYEQGICGTCATRVIDGLPDHRDSFLMDDEREVGGLVTLCCSRALTSELILDL